jgi:predicted ATPase
MLRAGFDVLQTIQIKNYRSIADASVDLQPFTILLGANGSGKSNLLRLLFDLGSIPNGIAFARHLRTPDATGQIVLTSSAGRTVREDIGWPQSKPLELAKVRVFSIDPAQIGGSEQLVPAPEVGSNGAGAIQVLDDLKTGDREDLFDTIERQLRTFIPEIQKLSFAPGKGNKSLQVREAGIPTPVPVRDLSEGTRLVLTLLTIVHQERKPSIICIEDLDHGLHPALFGKIVEVCRALVRAPGAPQIIATTHNPYVVDQFIDDEDSVVLVEKVDASTTFTTLRERLESLGLDKTADTFGGIWYSGLVGGVPVVPTKHLPPSPAPKAG